MTLSWAISIASQFDALAALLVAAGFVAFMPPLLQRRRPLTRNRLMDAWLTAILFFVLGMRYLLLAISVAIAPAAVIGQPGPAWLVAVLAGTFAVLATLGILSHRGSVALRVTGAVTLALASIAELVLNVFVLSVPITTRLDTAASVLIAAAAVVLAAFHWTHRTATPNPLGGDTRPIDY